MGTEYDERLLARADEDFVKRIVDCSSREDVKKALDSDGSSADSKLLGSSARPKLRSVWASSGAKVARFGFCSCGKDGEGCAEFIEKELQARVMGTRADVDEKVKVGRSADPKLRSVGAKCVVCGRKAGVIVYAGKSY